VTNILAFSDAHRRGLRYGDEILEIDGRVVQTANDVQNLLATFPAQWRIPVTFRQDGQLIETAIRLASVHRGSELLEKMKSALPPPPPARPKPEPDPDGDQAEDGPPPEIDPNQQEDPAEPKDPAAPKAKESQAERPKDASGEPIPIQAAERIEARKGFANYFYNQRRQKTFFSRLTDSYQALKSEATWKLTGKVTIPNDENAKLFELIINGDEGQLKVGDRKVISSSPDDFVQAVDQTNLSATLSALRSLHRMVQVGPDRFGETYYWGTAPLLGQRPLRDCTVATSDALENRFYQDTETGALEVIEVYADRDGDPAELWFDPSTEVRSMNSENYSVRQLATATERPDAAGSAGLPKTMQLRFGIDPIATFEIDSWATINAEPEPQPEGGLTDE
jgi:hypothetical protein